MSVNVDIIVLINALSAVVAIQSNIASLVFLGQLCIAYLYATKVARAILIAHRQFSYKKTPCKMQSVFVCILLSSNELTFRELASFTSLFQACFLVFLYLLADYPTYPHQYLTLTQPLKKSKYCVL